MDGYSRETCHNNLVFPQSLLAGRLRGKLHLKNLKPMHVSTVYLVSGRFRTAEYCDRVTAKLLFQKVAKLFVVMLQNSRLSIYMCDRRANSVKARLK